MIIWYFVRFGPNCLGPSRAFEDEQTCQSGRALVVPELSLITSDNLIARADQLSNSPSPLLSCGKDLLSCGVLFLCGVSCLETVSLSC